MSEQNVKTEGSFKIKTKPKLTDEQFAAKNKEPLINVPSNVTKVIIPKEETNAVQEQETERPVLLNEQPEVELQEVGQGNEDTATNVATEVI